MVWLLHFQMMLYCHILIGLSLCHSLTHWFIENDKIISEPNSIFRLHTPADLMLFISQSKAVEELKTLERESMELTRQQGMLKSQESKNIDREKMLFIADEDCQIAKKKLSKFDLYLSSFLRLEAKEIKIEDFLDNSIEVYSKKEEPICMSQFLFSMSSYDHLKGVSLRENLTNGSEYGLVNPIPQAKDISLFGHKIKVALSKNSTSWLLLNFAAIYWRIVGHSYNAVECLRRALHYSPREHKDLALVSLANVLHRSRYSLDAAILMHAALESTSDFDIVYFTLGNIYGALNQFDLANICFKYVTDLQPRFEAARLRMHAAKCEHRLLSQISLQDKRVQAIEGLEEVSLKQKLIENQQKDLLTDRSSSVENYDLNFGHYYEQEEYLGSRKT